MEINLTKTKVVIFNKSGEHIKDKIFFGTEVIENVTKYTYLGLEFECSGSMKNALKGLFNKSLKALFKLHKLTDQNFDLPMLLHIFDHTIAPIMLYGSEVWGIELAKMLKNKASANQNNSLEKNLDNNILTQLEMKFYRKILHVKRNAPILGVRGELGRHPLSIKAICRSISFLNNS